MKKNYCFPLLISVVLATPASAQITLTGASVLYVSPGSSLAVSSHLTIGAAATFDNEGQFDFGGDLTNNGTMTVPTAPTAAVRMTGAAAQSVTGTAPVPVQNLALNNATGATLSTNVSVANAVQLTNGLLTVAPATPLVLLPTAADPLETATARIVGPTQMAARSVGAAAFNSFLGVELPAGANIGTLTVTRVTGPTGIVTGAGNTSTAVYWEVVSSVGAARQLHFSWLAALDNGRNPAQATLWRSASPYTSWTRAAAPVSNATGSPRVFAPVGGPAEGVTGRFTFSDPSAPLPVELSAFTARRQGTSARLDWTTASEKNNAYFDVERSVDGIMFQAIGQVAGYGNSTTPHEYSLTDPRVAQYGVPTLYYRLRQVDGDGKSAYSPIRSVQVEAASTLLISAWPNPSAGEAPHIRIEQPTESPLTATLTDATGRHLAEYRTSELRSEDVFADKAAALPSGVYLLRVTTAGTSRVLKLVRE